MSTGENKRVRIDKSRNTTTTTTTTSPTAIALSNLQTRLLSLPFKHVQDSLNQLGTTYLKQQVKAHSKYQLIKKMEDDKEYIPKSARSDFKLTTLKSIEPTEAFVTLQTNVEQATKTYQQVLRDAIIQTGKLEHTELVTASRTTFLNGIRLIGLNVTIINKGKKEDLDKYIAYIFKKYPTLLNGLSFTSPTEAIAKYKEVHSITDMDIDDTFVVIDIGHANGTLSQESTQTTATIPINHPTHINTLINEIYNCIQTVLTDPFTRYKSELENKVTSLELLKTNKEMMTSKKTEETNHLLNQEGAVDPKTMMELIKKETQKVAKPLLNEIKSLKKTMSKNSKRGQSKTGANQKKSTKQSKKQQEQSSTSSTDQDKKPKATPANKNSDAKKGNSRKGRSKSPNRSNRRKGKKERNNTRSPIKLKND